MPDAAVGVLPMMRGRLRARSHGPTRTRQDGTAALAAALTVSTLPVADARRGLDKPSDTEFVPRAPTRVVVDGETGELVSVTDVTLKDALDAHMATYRRGRSSAIIHPATHDSELVLGGALPRALVPVSVSPHTHVQLHMERLAAEERLRACAREVDNLAAAARRREAAEGFVWRRRRLRASHAAEHRLARDALAQVAAEEEARLARIARRLMQSQ